MAKTKIFYNDLDGIAVEVAPTATGYGIRLRDVDAEAYLPTVIEHPFEADAVAHAQAIAAGKPFTEAEKFVLVW